MSPFSGLRALVTNLREELASSADAESLGTAEVPGLVREDEKRIYAILSDNGGQVRQQTIVEETEWSPSKVSRSLTRMESKGYIGRITKGREKTVVLPEDLR